MMLDDARSGRIPCPSTGIGRVKYMPIKNVLSCCAYTISCQMSEELKLIRPSCWWNAFPMKLAYPTPLQLDFAGY